MLVSMKFKSFIWPQNPRVFETEHQRALRHCKVPLTDKWEVQDMGKRARIFRGEGEFTGPTAYDDFKRLTEVFDAGGAGILYHPIWGSATAKFSKLSLREEPGEEQLAYSFEFIEVPRAVTVYDDSESYASGETLAGRTRYIPAESNDTVYSVAAYYNLTVAELMALNPWINDPDMDLRTGQLIKIRKREDTE